MASALSQLKPSPASQPPAAIQPAPILKGPAPPEPIPNPPVVSTAAQLKGALAQIGHLNSQWSELSRQNGALRAMLAEAIVAGDSDDDEERDVDLEPLISKYMSEHYPVKTTEEAEIKKAMADIERLNDMVSSLHRENNAITHLYNEAVSKLPPPTNTAE